ncbi:MAG: hypothetical protein ACI4PF_05760 [Christensenellales bacterium]
MNKRIKEVRERIAKDDFDYDEEGRAIVKINITDAECLLSPYNDDGMEIISEETANFINNLTKPIPSWKDIQLQISCEDYTQDKEQVYRNAITNYYVNEFADRDQMLKARLKISTILFLVSIISFALLYFMYQWNVPDILCSLVEVISWVFAWETVDLFVLQRYLIKAEQHKELQIIFATITFKRLGNQN